MAPVFVYIYWATTIKVIFFKITLSLSGAYLVFTMDGENGKAAITTQAMVIVTSPRYNSVSVKHCPGLRKS